MMDIQLITIQNKIVLRQLYDSMIYTASITRVPDMRVRSYQYMQKVYEMPECPVFCVPVGSNYAYFGFNTNNVAVLELEVPDGLVKLQNFSDWCGVIFYFKFPEEFKEISDVIAVSSIEDYADSVLKCKNYGSGDALQAVIPYIHVNWLTAYLADDEDVSAYLQYIETSNKIVSIKSFVDNTGKQLLSEMSYFK